MMSSDFYDREMNKKRKNSLQSIMLNIWVYTKKTSTYSILDMCTDTLIFMEAQVAIDQIWSQPWCIH